jgi:hypothetical protein
MISTKAIGRNLHEQRWQRRVFARTPTQQSSFTGRLQLAIVALAVLGSAANGLAAQVRGALTGYENSAPMPNRYLHFENQVTLDNYMAQTAADGSFAVRVPPGSYRLRAERGAILASGIIVGVTDITLGRVSELAPLAPARVWDLQSIAPAQVVSAAPSTANILTHDSVVLPTGELTVIGVNPLQRDIPAR